MNNHSENDKAMTIHDVARELGVSASTVSRAISGKGRIGAATRDRILDYIEEHGFPHQTQPFVDSFKMIS
jgi:DNA-binding LacI/PurR family transcriptional regulator